MSKSSALEKAIAILEDPKVTEAAIDKHYYNSRMQGSEQYVYHASTGYQEGVKYALKVLKEQQAKSK